MAKGSLCFLILLGVAGSRLVASDSGSDDAPKSYIWRGDGTGRFPQATPPTEWDGESKKNIRWSLKVGASKFTSPIVVGNKIFTVSDPAELQCIDATTGALLWQKNNSTAELPNKPEEKIPKGTTKNATPIPVCDGKYVYVSYCSGVVACYDLDGKRQWITHIEGAATSEFGRSASPVLAGHKVFVSLHHLIALDAKTGKVAWQNEKVVEKFGTPTAMNVGGLEILLAPSGQIVRVKDGQILATIPELPYTSPVLNGSVVYFTGPTTTALEIVPDGSESVKTKPVWIADLDGTFYGSAVFENGIVYAASNEGYLFVINAADGKLLNTQELNIFCASGRSDTQANLYPSPSIAGKYLFLSNDLGETLVIEPGKDYKEIKKNKMLEGSGGTPAFSGKNIFVRDGENLFCIGEK
jgi:outer membrane protein assembly factor BamB